MKAVLLYQVGIANVFIDGKRALQHAYSPCEWFCKGLIAAGASFEVKHCDVAGDVASFEDQWKDGKGTLWGDQKHPPKVAA